MTHTEIIIVVWLALGSVWHVRGKRYGV